MIRRARLMAEKSHTEAVVEDRGSDGPSPQGVPACGHFMLHDRLVGFAIIHGYGITLWLAIWHSARTTTNEKIRP